MSEISYLKLWHVLFAPFNIGLKDIFSTIFKSFAEKSLMKS